MGDAGRGGGRCERAILRLDREWLRSKGSPASNGRGGRAGNYSSIEEGEKRGSFDSPADGICWSECDESF
jgi:hypothetical protein